MGSLPCDSEPIGCCSSCLLPRDELASFPDIRIHRNVLLAEWTSCLVPRVELHIHECSELRERSPFLRQLVSLALYCI